MKDFIKRLKILFIYLRNLKEINGFYSYNLKHGQLYDEDMDWYQRTNYYIYGE